MPPSSAVAGPAAAAAAGTRRRDARGGRAPPVVPASDSGEHRDRHHHSATGLYEWTTKLVGWICLWLRRRLLVAVLWRPKPYALVCGTAVFVILLATHRVMKARSSPAATAGASTREGKFVHVSGRGIADLRHLGYRSKPRTMGCYFQGVEGESILKTKPRALYTYYERYPSKRLMHVSERAIEAQQRLQKSRHYRRGRAEPFETQECRVQYEWQLALRSTCNEVHQTDMNDLRAEIKSEERARIVASGFWRDTWVVRDYAQREWALKTMRYEHEFEPRNFDRHRRDALASERLSSSDNVVDIFSYCGNTGVYDFVSGGDINDAIWPLENDNFNTTTSITILTKVERLDIALQVATAIADMHNVDVHPSIAHTDITPGQFLRTAEGKCKLTDFNRVRFLRRNMTSPGVPCSYIVGRNPGKFRSPEEYNHTQQTEKVDIFSMGNLFYSLLTEYWPFEGMDEKEAQQKIMDGERPPIDDSIRNSSDPIDAAFIRAISMCWRQNPKKRATAKEVKQYLMEQIKVY
mmetsp:Transcript_25629/g.74150  ORF Transcript_25629/g.74150 Transcript_25629/m.74150 type:complete len:522 (-) Transcript_25629:3442-5007(-)